MKGASGSVFFAARLEYFVAVTLGFVVLSLQYQAMISSWLATAELDVNQSINRRRTDTVENVVSLRL